MNEHLACRNADKNYHKKNTIKKIQRNGLEPTFIKLLEDVDEQTAKNKEIELIAYYGRADRGLGMLTNMTDGGEGTTGMSHSEEAKRKIGKKAVIGKGWYNNGTITKLFKINEHPEGWVRGKLNNELRGMVWYTDGTEDKKFTENNNPEGWVRGRTALKGKPCSDKTKRKLSNANKGRIGISKGKTWYSNGTTEGYFFENDCPEGWIKGRLDRRRKTDRYLTIDGIRKTLKEWSVLSDTKHKNIGTRLRYGWSPKQAVYGK